MRPLLGRLARLALLIATAAFGAGFSGPASDTGTALREGNHLFRGGDLDGALAAFAGGWDGKDPILAYNLGATAHHLGHLPEALLWYRRAEAGLSGDPWLRDNLSLVREQLRAAERPAAAPAPTFWPLLMNSRPRLLLLGIAVAWAALLLFLLPLPPAWRRRRRWRLWMIAPAALLSCLAFGAGMLLPWIGPRPAVLLQDCAGAAGGLPAGSEVWVQPAPDGAWRLLDGRGLLCPTAAVGLIEP